jgi:hypothetical protein
MKKSSVAKCSECKKRRVIAAWVSFNQFCHDCWRTVLTDPKVRHKYQMASNQDPCTCGHVAGEHDQEGTAYGAPVSFSNLYACKVEACECNSFKSV